MAKLLLTAWVQREGDGWVALCPELDVASQGKTVEEALQNLKEAIELCLEDEDAEVPERPMTPLITSVEVETGEAPGRLRPQSC